MFNIHLKKAFGCLHVIMETSETQMMEK